MRMTLFGLFIFCYAFAGSAQTIKWENKEFEPINTLVQVVELNGSKVLKVERDLIASPFDEKNIEKSVDGPTYVKLKGLNIENGVIEVKVLSKIMENSPFQAARGFIGVAFRADSANKNFESIYLRPSNGRVEDQLRRNHTVQYFSYPNYNFSRLRKESNGVYETYADIGLNEWINVKIEFKGTKAALYINQQNTASFIVNELLGTSKSGSIALWVEVGTIGYFKDLQVTKL